MIKLISVLLAFGLLLAGCDASKKVAVPTVNLDFQSAQIQTWVSGMEDRVEKHYITIQLSSKQQEVSIDSVLYSKDMLQVSKQKNMQFRFEANTPKAATPFIMYYSKEGKTFQSSVLEVDQMEILYLP